MKRLLLLPVIAVGLAACGGGGETAPTSRPVLNTRPTTTTAPPMAKMDKQAEWLYYYDRWVAGSYDYVVGEANLANCDLLPMDISEAEQFFADTDVNPDVWLRFYSAVCLGGEAVYPSLPADIA